MELNQTMSPAELMRAQRSTSEVNARLRRPNGTQPGELGRDSFLRLLVTQLRHQDPTQPMQDKEFIAQMAQFSSLEQMTNINEAIQNLHKSSRASEAFSLLGKKVDAVISTSGEQITGTVSKISYRNNIVKILVNNRELDMSEICAVYPPDREEPSTGARRNPAPQHQQRETEILPGTAQ